MALDFNHPTTFPAQTFRQAFPACQHNTCYLDNAATTLKPKAMIEAIQRYYQTNSSTAHRSQHAAALSTTAQLEAARAAVAKRINAPSPTQIIWTSGTTAAINLAAQAFSAIHLQAGDEIIVTEMEHHSNLVPWLMAAKQAGARVIPCPLNEWALPDIDAFQSLLTPKTKLLAISQMSNVTGASPDLAAFIAAAKAHACYVLVDGAQGIVHGDTDVQALDIDFYCFSAHKLYGPTGVGVLYGKKSLLDTLLPVQGGGKMLTQVDFEGFTPAAPPFCFEAGTPNIAGILGFGATLHWLEQYDSAQAHQYCVALADFAEAQLSQLAHFVSYRAPYSPILAFNFTHLHHSDLAMLLAEQDIAIRSGQHCTQPLMKYLGITGCLRASFAPYNTPEEILQFVQAIQKAVRLLSE